MSKLTTKDAVNTSIGTDINDNSEFDRLKPDFRYDVEGLRAIAIILVVITHAGFSWLPGGFIGVDVFFVISGYLITGLLINEITHTGRLAWFSFVARRLKRLLPALLFMLVVVSAISIILLSPFDQYRQAHAAQYASIWGSNIYFALADTGYFEPSAERNLFLHTWSLGVEEQFYLFWPVLLLALISCRLKKYSLNQWLTISLTLVILTSLASLILLSQYKPIWAFYLMPGRIWEFGLGALVFVLRERGQYSVRDNDIFSKITRSISKQYIALIALGALLGTALLLTQNVTYPGLWALIPTISTAILLLGNSTLKVHRGLATAPFRLIGKISYSWYLWHWPVLVIGTKYFALNDTLFRVTGVLLSLALAWLSFRFVETPLRRLQLPTKKLPAMLTATVAFMVIALFGNIQWKNSAQQWVSGTELQAFNTISTTLPAVYELGCDEGPNSADLRICQFGDKDAEYTAVMFGDSILTQWFPALHQIYSEKGWRLLVLTKSACPMVNGPLFYHRIGREYTECIKWRKSGFKWLASEQPDVVIMGSSLKYTEVKNWEDGTRDVINQISASSNSVYVMQGTNILPFHGPSCLAQRYWQANFIYPLRSCHAPESQDYNHVKQTISKVVDEFPNVNLIDMNPAICNAGVCSASVGSTIAYRDNQHLTIDFVKSLSSNLGLHLTQFTSNE